MSLATMPHPSLLTEDERTELERLRREVARMRRESAALADETLERIAAGAKALGAGLRELEGIGRISEQVRAMTIPPDKRRRPARPIDRGA